MSFSEDLSKKFSLTKDDVIILGEYVTNGFVQWKAYKHLRTKKSEMQSRSESSTYFAKPNIRAALAEYLDRIIEGYKNTLHHDIIATYRARAFYKTEDILDENGNLQPNIPEELKCVIDGMELKPTTVGSGENAETMFVRKYTLANRDKALEMLTKYMALIKDRIELSGSVEITEHPVAAQLKLLRESIEKK